MISTSLGEKELTVFNKETFDSLLNSTLMFDTMLLEIPENSKVYIMANGEKLYLQSDVKDDMQMQDVEGVVIKKGKADVEVGDRVIFHYLSLNNGRDGFGFRLFTFAYNNKLYHVIPYSQIFFSIRNDEYYSHNGKYLVSSIENGQQVELDGKLVSGTMSLGGIVLIDLKQPLYKKDRCKIECAPSGSVYSKGDIVITNGVWDVPVKSEIIRKKDAKLYQCDEHNIVCKEEFLEETI